MAVKLNEIRVGNYFMSQYNTPFRWDLDYFNSLAHKSIDQLIKEPIPASASLLMRFGFRNTAIAPIEYRLEYPIFWTESLIIYCQADMIPSGITIGRLYRDKGSRDQADIYRQEFRKTLYIHTLQNLIFSITGKEWEINL